MFYPAGPPPNDASAAAAGTAPVAVPSGSDKTLASANTMENTAHNSNYPAYSSPPQGDATQLSTQQQIIQLQQQQHGGRGSGGDVSLQAAGIE